MRELLYEILCVKSSFFLNSAPTLLAFYWDIWKNIISVKTIFPKIKKDALNNIMFHEILLMKIMFFLYFFFAKLGKIREIQRNRSPWFKVAGTVNGMPYLLLEFLYFIVAFCPSELGSDFVLLCCFFFLLKGIQNTSKMLQRFFPNKVTRVIKIVFSKKNFRHSCRVCIYACNIYL